MLDNVRNSIRLLRPKMIAGLRELAHYLGRAPSIEEALDHLDTTLDHLLKRGLWSRLLAEAGCGGPIVDPDEQRLAKGLQRLCHVECAEQIRWWLHVIAPSPPSDETGNDQLTSMLQISLWGNDSRDWSLAEADQRLRRNPAALADLRVLLEYQLRHAPTHHAGRIPELAGPLTIHAPYTRDEILAGLGHWTLNRRPDLREGVLHLPESKVDAFFVTLQKSEADYSPTTMYEDYLISHQQFHWQSQSNTSVESPTGQRYIHHRELGYTPLLFVRETKSLPSGLSAPYYFLGPCRYLSHSGSRPVSIVWELRHPVPARLMRVMARQLVG
ncbi:MAG: DUF3427 domain-containing protein [Pirellulaceae bacterium]|nr:DUF3427 domain-containing protein [Pirellulaceae bacterium]